MSGTFYWSQKSGPAFTTINRYRLPFKAVPINYKHKRYCTHRNKSDKSKVVTILRYRKCWSFCMLCWINGKKITIANSADLCNLMYAHFAGTINDNSPWNLIATGYVIIGRDYKNLKANPRRGWEKSNSESQKGVATGNTTLGNYGDSDICSFLASCCQRNALTDTWPQQRHSVSEISNWKNRRHFTVNIDTKYCT